ncbi:MAG: hypothetical protein CYPHOPRED_003081, partial [Cyphobasidiales sp. Tagirdzhanova-0007]
RREDIRSDRLQQRGAFQVKLARTAKWIKDSSVKRTQSFKRHVRHTDPQPTAPETEGISSL